MDTLSALNLVDALHFPESYESLSTRAALQAEALACHLRNMLFDTANLVPTSYYKEVGVLHGIEVHCEDGVFGVKLPRLLPKKRSRDSDDFVLLPVAHALSAYVHNKGDPLYRSCTVCIEHVYSASTRPKNIRDYDNLQLKRLLDLIALYTMVDDSGKYCNLYQTTQVEDKPCTRVFVMPQERFPAWLQNRKTDCEAYRF